jgi:DNA primase
MNRETKSGLLGPIPENIPAAGMTTLTQQIKDLDLVALVEAEGIKLQRRGNKYFARCPFHNEKTASFCIFPDGHAKCFGCGWYGDAINLLQDLHGLNFKEALRHLGINQGPLTADMRSRMAKAKRKQANDKQRRQHKRDLLYTLAVRIRKIRKVMDRIKTTKHMEACAELVHQLPYLEHCHDVLMSGEPDQAGAVVEQLKEMPLILRNKIFNDDFDFSEWLRNFANERFASR